MLRYFFLEAGLMIPRGGGDIDIYVKTLNNISLKEELTILSQFERKGIDRKIDLIIDSPKKNKQTFFDSIKGTAILL